MSLSTSLRTMKYTVSVVIFAVLAIFITNLQTADAERYPYREYDDKGYMIVGSSLRDLKYMTLHQAMKKGIKINDEITMVNHFPSGEDKHTITGHFDWSRQKLHNRVKEFDKKDSKKKLAPEYL